MAQSLLRQGSRHGTWSYLWVTSVGLSFYIFTMGVKTVPWGFITLMEDKGPSQVEAHTEHLINAAVGLWGGDLLHPQGMMHANYNYSHTCIIKEHTDVHLPSTVWL